MADNNYAVQCSTLLGNVGTSECTIITGFVKGHILVPQDFEIDTVANAELLATWITARKAAIGSRAFPLPPAVKPEFTQDEAVYEDLGEGDESYLYTNTGKDIFYIDSTIVTPTFNANMQKLNNGVWSCYEVTSNGWIRGKSIDGTKFLPKKCKVRVLPQRKATDSEGSHLPYSVRILSYEDTNVYGAAIKPTDWNPVTDLLGEGLLDVNLTISGTPTSTEIIVDVKTDLNSIGVTDLVIGDFSFLKSSDGSTQTPDSMTESTTVDGRYTFVFTAAVTGTVDLVVASSLTVDGYESNGSTTYTIS